MRDSSAVHTAGPAPLTRWHYARTRDIVLTAAATAFSKSSRLLWYAETLVLSARYQQWIASSSWAQRSALCADQIALWEKLAEPRLLNAHAVALEFGVADGRATRWWSRRDVAFAAWHGFDTFEGLPGAWNRAGVPVMSAGVFAPSGGAGSVPQVTAPFPYTWHTGLIEDTLPAFVRPDAPLFVLIDVDLFEPALVILEWLKVNGRPGDMVYFDEAFDPWNEGSALRHAMDSGLRLRGIGHTGSSLLAEVLALDTADPLSEMGVIPPAGERPLDVAERAVGAIDTGPRERLGKVRGEGSST
jgi:hypothetical protein